MKDFLLAAVQIDTIAGEVMRNVHHAMSWTRRALEEGAKYVFLHEGLTADYTPEPLECALSLDSAEVHGFAHVAGEYDAYIGLGLNEVHEGKPFISMVWLGPDGIIGVYRKTYLWPNDYNKIDPPNFDKWLETYDPAKAGYRLERGVFGAGDGPRVIQVGDLRIGCLICADGSHPEAWQPFANSEADLIFWQNNRGNVSKPATTNDKARELRTPMVVSNRCGYSWHHFIKGGSCFIKGDGSTLSAANQEGREEIVFAKWSALSG